MMLLVILRLRSCFCQKRHIFQIFQQAQQEIFYIFNDLILIYNNNIGYRYTKNITPESVYNVGAIQKSLSYPSQRNIYNPTITPNPSITQLEANTCYSRGMYSTDRNNKRASMRTENTRYVFFDNCCYNLWRFWFNV